MQPIKQSATSNNLEKSGFVNIVLLLSVANSKCGCIIYSLLFNIEVDYEYKIIC